jgi:hypothetical protein
MGWSGIFGATIEDNPDDQVLLSDAETGTVSYELDTTNLETTFTTNPIRAKQVLAMRVPIWYDALQRPSSAKPATPGAEALVSRSGDD